MIFGLAGAPSSRTLFDMTASKAGGVIDSQPGVLNAESLRLSGLQSSLENVQEFRVESTTTLRNTVRGLADRSASLQSRVRTRFTAPHMNILGMINWTRTTFSTERTTIGAAFESIWRLAGGPIAKDKLFFYAYYEGYRLRSGINLSRSGAQRGCARSSCLRVAGSSCFYHCGLRMAAWIRIFNRFSRASLTQGCLGRSSKGGSSDPARIDIMQLNGLTQLQENSGGLRLDYHINNSNTLYARYFRTRAIGTSEGVTGARLLWWTIRRMVSFHYRLILAAFDQ